MSEEFGPNFITLTDEDGNTCYDYFESTETTATA